MSIDTVAASLDDRADRPRDGVLQRWARLAPGLGLVGGLAGAAFWLRDLGPLRLVSPLLLAMVLGMAVQNTLGASAVLKPGITFALKRLLRLAIIMLGLQITLAQVGEVGGVGIAIIAVTLFASLGFTAWLGRRLGVDRKLSQLIGVGTSICGASAVIAANTVTEGSEEDVAYAIAVVTVFGSLAIFLYPALVGMLQLGPRGFGLWAGASIHEIAQVVAAAFQDGKEAGEFGTIAKLSRVMMLAPVVLGLGVLAARQRAGRGRLDLSGIPLPWFVFGFIGMIGLNSLGILPVDAKAWAIRATPYLLAVALAAMGLETNVRKLLAKGVRPLLLGAGAWLFIALFSLAAIRCVYDPPPLLAELAARAFGP